MSTPLVGVLALQGDFAAHRAVLERLGATVRDVRVPADLEGLQGLIIPGGENVSSIEVEDVIFSHPEVAEVAVIGPP